MTQVLLVIHLILAVALVASVLLQRSEGGALGIGGGTMGGLMTARGSANLMTRATAILAACFIGTSLLLAILSSANRAPTSILDRTAVPAQTQPATPAGSAPAPSSSEAPSTAPAETPAVPLAK